MSSISFKSQKLPIFRQLFGSQTIIVGSGIIDYSICTDSSNSSESLSSIDSKIVVWFYFNYFCYMGSVSFSLFFSLFQKYFIISIEDSRSKPESFIKSNLTFYNLSFSACIFCSSRSLKQSVMDQSYLLNLTNNLSYSWITSIV